MDIEKKDISLREDNFFPSPEMELLLSIIEIKDYIDDKNIMLASSTIFVAENNLRVIILGTVPLGKVFTSTQLEGLYEYDFYEISLVQESTLNTAPTKDVDEYYIARVVNNDGTITIDNTKKTEYWTLANLKQ